MHLFVLCAGVVVLSGCNDTTGASGEEATDTASMGAMAMKPPNRIDPRLNVLTMGRDTFDRLVPNPGAAKKIVLKHTFSDAHPGELTLSAWREQAQRFEHPPVYLSNFMDGNVQLGEVAMLFGDQKLSRPQTRLIREAFNTNPAYRHIVFVPVSGKKRYGGIDYSVLYYDVHIVATLDEISAALANPIAPKHLAPLFSLNPSPPAAALDDEEP